MATLEIARLLCRQEERIEQDAELGLFPQNILEVLYPSYYGYEKSRSPRRFFEPSYGVCNGIQKRKETFILNIQEHLKIITPQWVRMSSCGGRSSAPSNFVSIDFRRKMYDLDDIDVVECCDEAIEVLPFWPLPDYLKGQALLSLNRTVEAQHAFQESLQKALVVKVQMHIDKAQLALDFLPELEQTKEEKKEETKQSSSSSDTSFDTMTDLSESLKKLVLASELRTQEMERKFDALQEENRQLKATIEAIKEQDSDFVSTQNLNNGKRVRKHVSKQKPTDSKKE